MKKLKVQCIFAKLTTIVDGSINVTFNLNDYEAHKLPNLIALKGHLLNLTIDLDNRDSVRDEPQDDE